jgi:hypothetical protein
MHVFRIYFPNGMREIERIRGGPGIDKVLDEPLELSALGSFWSCNRLGS